MKISVPQKITSEQIRNGQYNSRLFAPALWEIPSSYSQTGNPWTAVASQIMWGGSAAVLSAVPKAGIDLCEALLHVGAVLNAVDMTVEHRELAAGYLLDEWFTRIDATDGVAAGPGTHQRRNDHQAVMASL